MNFIQNMTQIHFLKIISGLIFPTFDLQHILNYSLIDSNIGLLTQHLAGCKARRHSAKADWLMLSPGQWTHLHSSRREEVQKLDKVKELRNITLVMMKGRSNRFFIPNQLEHYGFIPNLLSTKTPALWKISFSVHFKQVLVTSIFVSDFRSLISNHWNCTSPVHVLHIFNWPDLLTLSL